MLSHRDGSANDVRIALLGITDGAGLVEFLIADTNIGGTKLPVWKFGYLVVSSSLASLTPLLRGIVFIGKAAFRLCIDVGGRRPDGSRWGGPTFAIPVPAYLFPARGPASA